MIQPNDPISEYIQAMGDWTVEDLIGEGSYGRVYRASRTEFGTTYYSAIKLITIPKSDAEIRQARQLGMDQKSMQSYFEGMAGRIVNEVKIMHSLRGKNNIVCYEDHRVFHKDGEAVWTILIRMELLEPLEDYFDRVALGEELAIQLAKDILNALKVCEKRGIIHRDIKDSNVFVADDGTFKLGDFGIARELSNNSRSMSMRGTPAYLAPEIYAGKRYDATVDIYSLGILLYKLLNDGRYPFMPPASQLLSFEDTDAAFNKRMSGHAVPPPAHGSDAVKAAVMRACSFNPQDRFQTADEFLAAIDGKSPIPTTVPVVIPPVIIPSQNETTIPPAPKHEYSDKTVSLLHNNQTKDEVTPSPALGQNGGTISLFHSDSQKPVPAPMPSPAPVPASNTEPAPNPEPISGSNPAPVTKAKKKGVLLWLIPVGMVAAAALIFLIVKGLIGSTTSGTNPVGGENSPPSSVTSPALPESMTTQMNTNIIIETRVGENGVINYVCSAEQPASALTANGGSFTMTQQDEYRESIRSTTTSSSSSMDGWTLYDQHDNDDGWSDWGEWQNGSQSGSDSVEVRTQHRMRELQTTTSESASLGNGWDADGTKQVFGNYGNWSDWQTDPVSQSDTCEVETRQGDAIVETQYYYFYYYGPLNKYGASVLGGTVGSYWRTYSKNVYDNGMSAGKDKYDLWSATKYKTGTDYGSFRGLKIDGKTWFCNDPIKTREQETGKYQTEYRYRTRTASTVYKYKKWGDWSSWSDTAYTASATVEVDTRQQYRTRARVDAGTTYYFEQWSDWSAWQIGNGEQDENTRIERRTVYIYSETPSN